MAYSPPPSKTAGSTFDLTAYDAVRDSILASAVASFSAKGDIFGGTGSTAGTRLAVGANDSILVADSSQTTGLAWQICPAVAVKNSGTFDPSTSTWVSVTWDSEDNDTDGMHSTSSNTSRLTVPSGGAGYYLVIATIEFDTTTLAAGQAGQYGVRIRYNGSTVFRTVFDDAEAPADADLVMQVAGIPGMNVGDYVECQVYTTRDINVTANSRFEAIWQRRL